MQPKKRAAEEEAGDAISPPQLRPCPRPTKKVRTENKDGVEMH